MTRNVYIIKYLLLLLIIVHLDYTNAYKEWWENSAAIELNDANFADSINNDKDFFIVEFYTKWCQFCKKLAPIYNELVSESLKINENLKSNLTEDSLVSSFKVARIECDSNQMTSMLYGIYQFPTIVAFTNGKAMSIYDGPHETNNILFWSYKNMPYYKLKKIESNENSIINKEELLIEQSDKIEFLEYKEDDSDYFDINNNINQIHINDKDIENLNTDLNLLENKILLIRDEINSMKYNQTYKSYDKIIVLVIISCIIVCLIIGYIIYKMYKSKIKSEYHLN